MRWPDLRTLRLLVLVAETGSLSAAARHLDMAQPNASRQMRALEADLGLSLVRRGPTGSTLTHEGRVVVDWAREVVRSADELMNSARALRQESLGQLTVSASMTVAEYLMPRWLAEFHRRFPDVDVSLDVHNSYDVCALVARGAATVGFIESPEMPSGLQRQVITRDRLVVVTSPEHRWARRRKPVGLAELADTPLIVREPGSGTRITLDRLLARHHPVDPMLALTSNSAVKVSAAAGLAPAVLSVLAVQGELRSSALREVAVDADLGRPIRAVWTGGRLRGPAADLVRLSQRLAGG